MSYSLKSEHKLKQAEGFSFPFAISGGWFVYNPDPDPGSEMMIHGVARQESRPVIHYSPHVLLPM